MSSLVLLPGLDGTGDLLAPLLHALDSRVATTVVRYPDSPGDYAAHEVVARAALPVDQRYVLLGESFSGPVAVSIASTRPHGCVGLILCASFLTSPSPLLSLARPLLPVFSPQSIPSFLTEAMLMGRYATDNLRKSHREVLAKVQGATLAARLSAISTVDVRAALEAVSVPVLYLRATHDRLVPPAAGDAVLRHARDGRLVDVDAPHFLLQTAPQAATDAIESFLHLRAR